MAKRIKKYKDNFFAEAFKIRSEIIDEVISFNPAPLKLFSIHVVIPKLKKTKSFLTIGRNQKEAISEMCRIDSEVDNLFDSFKTDKYLGHLYIVEK